MRLAAITIFLVLAGVCAQESDDIRNVLLDQEFNIKVGQRVEVKSEKLQIRFTSVPQDSRCPKGAQCITQGNAKIELELVRQKSDPASVSLNTDSGLSEADYQGYTIRLIALNPYPSVNQSIRQEEYEATLVVSFEKKGE